MIIEEYTVPGSIDRKIPHPAEPADARPRQPSSAMAPGCYMLDFSVYKPPAEYKVNHTTGGENAKRWSMYIEENTQFQLKVVKKSGLDVDGTYLPPAIHPSIADEPKTDMKTAMLEAEMVMGGAVSDLLEKTGIKPEQIDILISNCSIFCPTPSLASMLINKFKFRRDIQAYHLGGMGCSIGVVAVGLVRDMLKAHPNSIALFVPAEITTYCFYPGRHKDFLVANAIFRMGGAAMLMTNKPSLYSRCKYELQHAERVHTGQDDACISWGPDEDGINGVFLGKDVPVEAGKMLQAVIAKKPPRQPVREPAGAPLGAGTGPRPPPGPFWSGLGRTLFALCLRGRRRALVTPKIMTWGQYAEAAYRVFGKKVLGCDWGRYVPDYTKCMDHFALHAGGYAVLKGIQKGMSLPTEMMLPSFASLRDMGNTSSSTTWYSMAYMERFGMVKQGQRIMQVRMGGLVCRALAPGAGGLLSGGRGVVPHLHAARAGNKRLTPRAPPPTCYQPA
ncbi:3-ketoacyl-CoA synthase 6 [Monoraphidium neglectum]|uniref:3-ketoacyl-CoA synthase n=1 Tax=Monoraphidium neglectum TaxID=145388 RepID=A0A0D2KLM6_9CHLO|nr:3-ketoacyl-CoA synthase 6 [Monoraphidium neglectum]KIY96628.1 3-ketoacyl-CoA synthase 6 [Monoraphidium neglectum]|eukprot:XP_013895648.1 3-ketoacyl-CoA synthase 6 [Monoraphidium neglectum]